MVLKWISPWLVVAIVSFDLQAACQNIWLTRHYDKNPPGSEQPLTQQGQSRVQQLVSFLRDQPLFAVYATNYGRTQATAKPVAAQHQLSLLPYDPSQLPDFANQLLVSQHHTLVVGHSNTTPELARLLGAPIATMSEKDYGDLYRLTIRNGDLIDTQHWLIRHDASSQINQPIQDLCKDDEINE